METLKMLTIRSYKGKIENLKWHVKNNSSHISAEEYNATLQRIRDFEEFIDVLNNL